MFLNTVAAQTAGSSAGANWQMLLPLILVFGVMYFLIIRPQNRRMKEQQNMQSSIKNGDTIATSGGLIGRVIKLEDKEIHVDFNRSGQTIRVLRTAVVGLVEPTNKAKTMTQPNQENGKAVEKAPASATPAAAPKPRVRSSMNRGRAGTNNRRPASKKTEE
ncbi:MAG: preprotein translocase subunit YajC [Candidatus Paracaedibacteraceae bacterium]|nr:preprotein translocase subunit YajC [Candidatus Paracaedibacteraceae bacterium]